MSAPGAAARVREELRGTGHDAPLPGAARAGADRAGPGADRARVDRAGAARARAARAGRRRAGALAGVVCLAVLTPTSAALWPGWPARLAAAGSPARADLPPVAGPAADDLDEDLARAARSGLDPGSVLTPAELEPVVPSARVVTASVVDPADVAVRDGGVTGGWCGNQLLAGVETPATRWWVGWGPQVSAPPGVLPPHVTEQVLRFARPDAATGYVEATAASSTRCFDSFDSTSPGRSYVPQGALEPDGSPVVVAAAELPDAPGTFSVRALRGRGRTVVDLTVRLDADDADAAGTTVLDLLDTALSRAVGGTPDDSVGPTRPATHRLPVPDRRHGGGQPRPERPVTA